MPFHIPFLAQFRRATAGLQRRKNVRDSVTLV